MAVNDETRMTFEEVIAKIEQIKRESLREWLLLSKIIC